MLNRLVRIQLVAFVVVSVSALVYGSTQFLDLGAVVNPPHLVEARFAEPGGIYPRADVDLLGVRVGSVKEIVPGPGAASTVVLALETDANVPADVEAVIRSKSAIGEQYVDLTPRSADGPRLEDGDVIPLGRTTSPPDLAGLLGNLDALAGSLPPEDAAKALEATSRAFGDVGPTLGRLIEDSHTLTRRSVENVDALTSLIESAATVLDTQVEVGGQTSAYLRDVAGLTTRLRELDATFDETFVHGIAAGTEVTGLLQDNQEALPVLLNNLVALTTVGTERVPQLRKTLVVFPWLLEQNANTLRYCDEYDPATGEPVEGSCHVDEQGRPIVSAHLAQQLPEDEGAPPYYPCTRGYDGTVRYQPNGRPVRGDGPLQDPDSPPNMQAHCAAPPTDPRTPNVRGAQNVVGLGAPAGRPVPGAGPRTGLAMLNPETGLVALPDGSALRLTGLTGQAPPRGAAGLGWLLTHLITGGPR